MQYKTSELDVKQSKDKLNKALARLEKAIDLQAEKFSKEQGIRNQVVAELETYIKNLEELLSTH